MSKKKNRFREWLSDNLRYFILGIAVFVIVALLFVGFYFLTTIVMHTQLDDRQTVEDVLEPEEEQNTTEDQYDWEKHIEACEKLIKGQEITWKSQQILGESIQMVMSFNK